MAKQLLKSWKRHRRSVQSVGRRIEQCLGERVTQIVRTEGGSKLCRLTQFGNDFPNATFRQRPTLTEKEMPLRPAAPGSDGFSSNGSSFTPLFSQMFTMGEIRLKRFACFLNERDLSMFKSFASADNEQPTPGRNLHIGNLEGCHFRDAWACIAHAMRNEIDWRSIT